MPLIPMAPPGGPAGADPSALLALLAGGAGAGGPAGLPGPPPPDQAAPDASGDPLAALQSVIQDLHALIAVLPGGQDTQVASQCLAQLTKMQAGMMQQTQQAGDVGQAVAQRLGGGSAY